MTGSKNHAWKGGKATCLYCDKILFSRHQKTCKAHVNGIKKISTHPSAGRKNIWNSGVKSNFWKGGISLTRDYKAILESNRRAKIKQSTGNFSPLEWEELKMKYRYMCLCCKKSEPEIRLTADHIIPIALGGVNTIDNIQPLCGLCNSIKKINTTNFINNL